MVRNGREARLDVIRAAVEANPGRRAGWIARLLGLDNKAVQRALPQLEARGDLLAEDEKGGLLWVGKRPKNSG